VPNPPLPAPIGDCSNTPLTTTTQTSISQTRAVTYCPALMRFFQNTATAGWPVGTQDKGRARRFFRTTSGVKISGARGGHPFGQLAREFNGGLLESHIGMNYP
jgi:hypothetical protein